MKYEYRKLKGRIKEIFGTQSEFARALDLSRNSVSNKLIGRTDFSQSDVECWAKLLDIDRAEYGLYFYT